MSYGPQVLEPLVDFLLPPRYPSRYRVQLLAISRCEAQVRFGIQPRIFRNGEFEHCPSRLMLVWAFRAAHVAGELFFYRDDRSVRAQISFDRMLGLHEVAFFRRACGLPMTREDELPGLPPPPADVDPEDPRRMVVLWNAEAADAIEPLWEAVG